MRGYEVVYILSERATDWRGDPIVGGAETEVPVTGATTWPRVEPETNVVIEGLSAFLPPGAPVVGAKDQIRARDEVWDVDGEPAVFLKKGVEKGTIVQLKRAGT